MNQVADESLYRFGRWLAKDGSTNDPCAVCYHAAEVLIEGRISRERSCLQGFQGFKMAVVKTEERMSRLLVCLLSPRRHSGGF